MKEKMYKQLEVLPKQLQVQFALYCAKDVLHLVASEDKYLALSAIKATEDWLVADTVATRDAASAAACACGAATSLASYAAYTVAHAAHATAAYAAHATSLAAYAAYAAHATANAFSAVFDKQDDKVLKRYYDYLVNNICNFTELEKIIYEVGK